MCENEKEAVDDALATIGLAVGVLAATWGIYTLLCFFTRVIVFAIFKLFYFLFRASKIFSSSESSSSSNDSDALKRAISYTHLVRRVDRHIGMKPMVSVIERPRYLQEFSRSESSSSSDDEGAFRATTTSIKRVDPTCWVKPEPLVFERPRRLQEFSISESSPLSNNVEALSATKSPAPSVKRIDLRVVGEPEPLVFERLRRLTELSNNVEALRETKSPTPSVKHVDLRTGVEPEPLIFESLRRLQEFSNSESSSSSSKNVVALKPTTIPTPSVKRVDPCGGVGRATLAYERPRHLEEISSKKKVEGWLKLNTDASCKRKPNCPYSSVAIGGVFMDDDGAWVQGFVGKILSCDIHEAELYAIREGLRIAWESGFKNIDAETDCNSAERLFKGKQDASNDLQKQLVQDCTNLRRRNWTIRLKHIYREANEVADRMAELGHIYHDKIKIFEVPPNDKRLKNLLSRKKNSNYESRT